MAHMLQVEIENGAGEPGGRERESDVVIPGRPFSPVSCKILPALR